jgi:hypothetical protein
VGLDATQWYTVAEDLPPATSDKEQTGVFVRGGSYGEQYVLSPVPTKHMLADEGSYFTTSSASFYQPDYTLTYPIYPNFLDTMPFIYVNNNDKNSNQFAKRLYLDYLKVVLDPDMFLSSSTAWTNPNWGSARFAIILDIQKTLVSPNFFWDGVNNATIVSPNSDIGTTGTNVMSSTPAISFDNAAIITSSGQTLSITVGGGSNEVLLVGTLSYGILPNVQCNGAPMIRMTNNNNSTAYNVNLHFLAGVSAGSASITTDQNCSAINAVSYFGVSQTTPPTNFSTSNSSGNSTLTLTLTTQPNSWMVGLAWNQTGDPFTTVTGTDRLSSSFDFFDNGPLSSATNSIQVIGDLTNGQIGYVVELDPLLPTVSQYASTNLSIAQVSAVNSVNSVALSPSSSVSRLVANASLGAPTPGDELVLISGTTDPAAYSATTGNQLYPGRKVSVVPPIIVGPGTGMTIYFWMAGVGMATLPYTFEMGWWER